MQHLARKIIGSHKEIDETYRSALEEPDYKEIEDHHEAKETMKVCLEAVIEEVQTKDCSKETKEIITDAKEIIADP